MNNLTPFLCSIHTHTAFCDGKNTTNFCNSNEFPCILRNNSQLRCHVAHNGANCAYKITKNAHYQKKGDLHYLLIR